MPRYRKGFVPGRVLYPYYHLPALAQSVKCSWGFFRYSALTWIEIKLRWTMENSKTCRTNSIKPSECTKYRGRRLITNIYILRSDCESKRNRNTVGDEEICAGTKKYHFERKAKLRNDYDMVSTSSKIGFCIWRKFYRMVVVLQRVFGVAL